MLFVSHLAATCILSIVAIETNSYSLMATILAVNVLYMLMSQKSQDQEEGVGCEASCVQPV